MKFREGVCSLTCNGLGLTRTLSPREEDDVSLVGADIIALEKVELVYSVVLQRRNLDNRPDRPCEILLKHEILLSLNLW